jgi:hypothetical protein
MPSWRRCDQAQSRAEERLGVKKKDPSTGNQTGTGNPLLTALKAKRSGKVELVEKRETLGTT